MHKDKRFIIIVKGSDPRALPKALREAIDAIACEKKILTLEGAIKRIENFIE